MLTTIIAALLLAAPPNVAVTRWVSPDNSRPTSRAEWLACTGTNDQWKVRTIRAARAFPERCDILVQDSIYPAIAARLDTLLADLAAESTGAALYTVTGTSAESLRGFLAAEYADGMTQAVFVGDLPVAWFQMIDDWNSNGSRDPDEGYEEFPCDLFFMDVDGVWQDTMCRLADTLDSLVPGPDGIYDQHSGNINPELAISRLPASVLGDAESILNAYLARDHAYRTGNLPLPERALVYIDDDWAEYAPEWSGNVGLLYPDRVTIAGPETTRCIEYRPRIDSAAYQWISLCSHSWPGGHAMYYNHHVDMDWFYATEIEGINPYASFYNLFACSNARYVEQGFAGGCYAMLTSTGLGAVGTTKTGSMLEFADYYHGLSTGRNLGQAMSDWLYLRMADQWENWEKAWFMGMVTIGDGTLKPRNAQTAVAETPQPPSARPFLTPTIARNVLVLNSTLGIGCWSLSDATGRSVMPLNVGANDVSALPSGIYFVCLNSAASRPVPVTVVH